MRPHEPVTPGRDPATIDRRTLVGVGELTTPRWARGARSDDFEFVAQEERVDELDDEEGVEVDMPEDDLERDLSDSPWTIEAIDGEQDERTEVSMAHILPQCLSENLTTAAHGSETGDTLVAQSAVNGGREWWRRDPISSPPSRPSRRYAPTAQATHPGSPR